MVSVAALWGDRARRIAGLMSGTSLDGVDVAIADFSGSGSNLRMRLLAFHSEPYPESLRRALFVVQDPRRGRLRELAQLHMELAVFYAEAVRRGAERAAIPVESLDAVGCHGQTVYHIGFPDPALKHRVPATCQIGSGPVLAQLLGRPVVYDFRSADIAAGGQGAPLVPYFDWVMFRHERENRLLLNIGGIANVTVLPAGGALEEVWGFDTGPGNMLIDALARRLFGLDYDPDGRGALAGRVDEELLKRWLGQRRFRRPPPRSFGREQFGARYLEGLLRTMRRRGLSPEDMMATVSALTVEAIWRAYGDFVASECPAHRVLVGGGGAHNRFLMQRLKWRFAPVPVETTWICGVDPDAREALCFALLAHEFFQRTPTNLPRVTGARRRVVLGALALP
ncbi:MAG: anhydro-N-acetylmuramic acid kinase [Bacteroidota bacterium]|nr:anhydro-N-acetylmuramic acid kinase [Bacteroidota bacterium]MDW8136844.1 anhydro-N-acetylmuramic acid kinase [Bacteroidota bacterium]